jgi:flagellar biosynthesis GTPase FlhF
MNKTYFIAPFVALLIFSGFYVTHKSGLEGREKAKAVAAEAALKAKNDAELEARKVAMADAIKAAEERKKEKEAKALKEAADKEARQAAIDARDKAFRDQEKSAKQIERLKKDLEVEQAALAKLAAERKEAEAEKAFLVDFVAKAQANVQALQAMLTKLNAPPAAPVASAK